MKPADRHDPDRRSATEKKAPTRRVLKLAISTAILLVIAFFIGRSIWLQWDQISGQTWRLHPGWLALSAVVMWLDFLIIIQLWRLVLFAVSQKRLRFGAAFRITVLSNLGKYVPGKVWAVLGMVYFLRREGYTAAPALASTVLHQAFMMIAGAVFMIVVLGAEVLGGLPVFPLIIGAILSVVVLYPPVFSGLLNWCLRLVKREPVTFEFSFARAVGLFGFYIVAWIVYGTSFWCMLKGLGIQPAVFWETVAAFGAAYLLGFLFLVAPGGLGVREGALVVLLGPQLGQGLAAFVAVVARLWMTLLELTELIPLAGGLGRARGDKADPND